jgi:hypothetical protein
LTNFSRIHIDETDDTTWTDYQADGDEYYYMVVPLDGHGMEKSSTYSVGVRKYQLREGYNLISLELEPISSRNFAVYTDSWLASDEDALFYYDRVAGFWIGRTRFLPENINNVEVGIGSAYIAYIHDTDVSVSQSGV